jgi:UMF1 family MFS transporter
MAEGLPPGAVKISFIVVASWWLLLSLPSIITLRQNYGVEPSSTYVQDSFRRLLQTLQNIKEYKQVFLFLLAYFFYIDGVGTIISMSTAYGIDLGFGVTLLIGVLLFIQVVAFPFAIFYGKLALRYSAKTMLLVGIGVYCLVTLLAFSLSYIENTSFKIVMFWFVAFLVASSMGGIQALSRSYFGKLIPPEKSAEFFGFYNVFGKFAAISGPFIMASVGWISGDTRWGVLSILVLFIIGGLLLWKTEAR